MTPAMRDRLTDDGRRRLCHELLGRLREYARRPPGSALQAVVAVDDALHIHVAAPGSWWHGLSRRWRALVDQRAKSVQAAGHQVDVQPLLLDYRGVREYTGGNDVAVDAGGRPGDVLSCLRAHTRIDGHVRPGRVFYRAAG
jgi:hypothetical protein